MKALSKLKLVPSDDIHSSRYINENWIEIYKGNEEDFFSLRDLYYGTINESQLYEDESVNALIDFIFNESWNICKDYFNTYFSDEDLLKSTHAKFLSLFNLSCAVVSINDIKKPIMKKELYFDNENQIWIINFSLGNISSIYINSLFITEIQEKIIDEFNYS